MWVCGDEATRRFIKQHGNKAAEFVECIDHMHVVGPASSFLDYTRELVDKVRPILLVMMHIISSLRLRLPCKWAAHPAYSYKLHGLWRRIKEEEESDDRRSNEQ